MPFVSAFSPTEEQSSTDWWFVFRGDELLVKAMAAGIIIPCASDVTDIKQNLLKTHYLGKFNGIPCYVGEVDEHLHNIEGMSFLGLRALLGLIEEDIFLVAGTAFQILHWERSHQFCGRCGSRLEAKGDERAKTCVRCGLISYPEISPAIIVAVTKDSKILLAQSPRFQDAFYSVLAGFVEPGETFEQCVRREVKEEVGIDVENIRYFASQPWPFPHTLMVGFTADYAGGEITVDNVEITDAQWFKADDLPVIPRAGTIAHRLIDWFSEKYK
jgi:NAD+ diphosphatase